MNEVKTIAQQVRELIAREAGIPLAHVRDEKALEDVGLTDSLERVEFVMALEDTFGISIPDEDAQKLDAARVREWVQYVEARRSGAPA